MKLQAAEHLSTAAARFPKKAPSNPSTRRSPDTGCSALCWARGDDGEGYLALRNNSLTASALWTRRAARQRFKRTNALKTKGCLCSRLLFCWAKPLSAEINASAVICELKLIKNIEQEAEHHANNGRKGQAAELEAGEGHISAAKAGDKDNGGQRKIAGAAVINLGFNNKPGGRKLRSYRKA